MENKKTGQLLTIILCIALIIGVIFAKSFTNSKTEKTKINDAAISKDTSDGQTEVVKSSESIQSTEQEKVNTKEESKVSDDIINGGENLKNVDTSLYEENIEGDALPEGTTQINFAFTNGEVLYDKGFPSGIYKNIKEEFQKYINENIPNPESIVEIEIVEDSITETDKLLSFKVDLKNGTFLLSEVDLHTFVYSFSVVK